MTDTISAIRRFFDSYKDCYDRLDATGAAAHHATPSFVVNRGDVVVIEADSVASYFDSVFAENGAEGEHFWEIAEFDAVELASNGAIVTVRWIAKRPDGSPLWRSRASYMVADDGEGWLIWGNMVHQPKQ